MADLNGELDKPSSMKVIGRIFRFIFTTNSAIWFERDLTNEIIDYQPKIPVEIDTSSTDKAIEWVKSLNQLWMTDPKEINTALDNNHCWATAHINGKIIGCNRIGFRNVFITDFNKVVEFPKKMSFFYDIYTIPEQRSNGVAMYLVIQSLKFCKSKGYTKVGNHVPAWNKASIRVSEKMGFKRVCYIRNFRIFGVPIRIKSKNKKNSILRGGEIQRQELPYD